MARKEKTISASIIIIVEKKDIQEEQIQKEELKEIKKELVIRFMESIGYTLVEDKTA